MPINRASQLYFCPLAALIRTAPVSWRYTGDLGRPVAGSTLNPLSRIRTAVSARPSELLSRREVPGGKPGELRRGAAALAQARASGVLLQRTKPSGAARSQGPRRRGGGTRALIEVLLLHRAVAVNGDRVVSLTGPARRVAH